MQADGWSLDDKRQPLLSGDKLGVVPKVALGSDDHDKNNLPDLLLRWSRRDNGELDRPRTVQSFCVEKGEIAATGSYDLSLNRYKTVQQEEETHISPGQLIADLKALEDEIQQGLSDLLEMVG